jgi:hypothetical protein
MSIKDLFSKEQQVLNVKPEEVYDQVESQNFIDKTVQQKEEFIPQLDFSKPENFARYGRAQDYYTYAYEHIQNNYPYDGSEKEITEWKNGLTFLEKYVFENVYPKATGFITLNTNTVFDDYVEIVVDGETAYYASSSSPQYVKIKSGPNSGVDIYRDGNIYKPNDNRTTNFNITPDIGNTVEFWFKLNSGLTSQQLSCSFAIFDLWNGEPLSVDTARVCIDVTPCSGTFKFSYIGGNNGTTSGANKHIFTYVANELTNWHHYAFTAKNYGEEDLEVCFYVDGQKVESAIIINEKITYVNNRGIVVNLGAYRLTPDDGEENQGALLGSLDEVRFWKKDRGQRDISRYRFDKVYGGSDSDLSNTDLGAYYRFNEGIFDSEIFDNRDSLILDYSGRLSNGTLINGDISVRQTGSAINSYGQFDSAEPKEPIIYSTNALVENSLQALLVNAVVWDENNNNSIYRSLPEWIISEDEEKDSQDLKKLTQIIATYFDKLYLQIKFLPKNEYKDYVEQGQKPAPFTNTILESHGFIAPDIFVDSSIIESINSRDEERIFEEKIYDLKNLIYKNIYNNLTYIYKTKGTEKAYRNLIRCFGVDDEVIKLNIYANNTEYSLEDNKKETVVKKKLLDLSKPETYNSNLYNSNERDVGTEGYAFVKPTLEGVSSSLPPYLVPLTFETEIHFPKKLKKDSESYTTPDNATIALFGGSTVANPAVDNDYTTTGTLGFFNFDVSLEKNDKDGRGGYFKLSIPTTGETISSPYYFDIYEGDKWNFAFRLSVPYESLDKIAYSASAFDSTPVNGDYKLELYAVNIVEDVIKNEFILTSSALPIQDVKNIHGYTKRFYVGAKKQNFTGSLVYPTEIKVAYARLWFDYLQDSEIKNHAKDPFNIGRLKPLNKRYQVIDDNLEDINSLVFNWEFDTLSNTNGSGKLFVLDSKSKKEIGDSVFNDDLTNKYPAIVTANPNNSDIIKYNHVLVSRQQIPENLFSSNTINILGESDFTFTKDTRPISLYWAFEKSMYQAISEEMLHNFAGIIDFNTLVGAPINKFRENYRDLNAIKTKFFHKVENIPSLEKYLEYYKWIDSSIGLMLNQLAPAGAAVSDSVRNIVEASTLERSKVQQNVSRFKRNELTYAQVKGIKELKYNWRKGHAPDDINNINQEESSLWLKERAERTDNNIFVPSGADSNKQTILNSIVNETNKPPSRVYDTKTATIYNKTTYYERRLARIVDPVANYPRTISDTIAPYSIENVKDTLDNTVSLRPVASGSEFERITLFNQPRANYSKEYQVFHAPGREINKKHFVEIEGVYSASQPSTNISGTYERLLPNMGRYEGIMVNRFSSPGTPETQGRGFLDKESESLSPYNTINYRNSVVRNNFDTWLKNTASIEPTFPSYHKINKNPLRSASKAFYDNGFIVHQIPRSDYGYSWISTAVTGVLTSSGPYSSIYPNIDLKELAILSASVENGITIDFVGLADSTITKSIDEATLAKTFTPATELHKYLLKENGPYSYSSWRQVRGNNNILADKLSKNNKFLIRETEAKQIGERVDIKSSEFFEIEPSVQWNRPATIFVLLSKLFSNTLATNNTANKEQTVIAVEFSNALDWIANPILRNYIRYSGKQTINNINYKKIFNLYTSKIQDENEPLFKQITGREIIFPRKKHVSLGKFRNKKLFSEVPGTSYNGYDRNIAKIRTFWRNRLEDRLRTKAVFSTSSVLGETGKYFGSISSLSYVHLNTNYDRELNYTTAIQHSSSLLPVYFNINLSNSVDSVWGMDVSSSYENTQTNIFAISQSNNIFGEIAPYKEYELRKLVMLPSGTFTGSNKQFVYDNNNYRVLPRPQFLFINHYPSYFYDSTSSYYMNEGTRYLTNEYVEDKPWYDSYEAFSEDVRPHTQNYSVLPEFKISDHIPFFITDKNSNFSVPINYRYLNLDGFEIENKYIGGSSNTGSNGKFSQSDLDKTTITTEYFFSDGYDSRIEDENEIIGATLQRFNLNFKTIKKFKPNRNFYPQQKAVEIAQIFADSLKTGSLKADSQMFEAKNLSFLNSNTNANQATPYDQQIATILQPFFAPGILFNSIRSGLAVDWPVYIGGYSSYSSSTVPEFYTTASSEALANSSLTYVLGKNFDYRVPFNALLNPNTAFLEDAARTGSLYYVNPTFYSSDVVSGSDRNYLRYPFVRLNELKLPSSLYQLAINNYMSEIVRFFIDNSKLTSYASKPQNEFKNFISGAVYKMYVSLQSNMFPDSEIPFSLFNKTSNDKGASYFGPPSKYFDNGKVYNDYQSTLGDNEYNKENLLRKEAFAPYLPPYYFGESKATLIYTASSDKPTLDDILKNLKIVYEDQYLSSSLSGITNNSFTSSVAYQNRMKIDASINLKQKSSSTTKTFDQFGNLLQTTQVPDDSQDVWSLQTYFEAPILDFSLINNTQNEREINTISGSIKNSVKIFNETGLWSGYGIPTNERNGIKFLIKPGENDRDLLENCGFNTNKANTQIGKLAQIKEVSEGIVAIPYITYTTSDRYAETFIPKELDIINKGESNKDNFRCFKIKPEVIDKLLGFGQVSYKQIEQVSFPQFEQKIRSSSSTNIIIKTMKLMLDYNLPPHLNWVRNRNLEPFVIYIAEFKQTLKEENNDLSNIWQGLMPSTAKKTELDSLNIRHGFTEDEFYHGKKIPNGTSFRIFKIKKRATYNYSTITNNQNDDLQLQNILQDKIVDGQLYSYNYPYDDFSLVEACKVELAITTGESTENLPPP